MSEISDINLSELHNSVVTLQNTLISALYVAIAVLAIYTILAIVACFHLIKGRKKTDEKLDNLLDYKELKESTVI